MTASQPGYRAHKQRLERRVAAAETVLETVKCDGTLTPAEKEEILLRRKLADHEAYEANAALKRMEKGVYGICECCERPIGEARLLALPAARFCVSCQRMLERIATRNFVLLLVEEGERLQRRLIAALMIT